MRPKLLLPLLVALFSTPVLFAQTISRYDIVIDEIMADPSPQVGLPNAEYIEVKNTSGHDLDLSGFRLRTASSTSGAFPPYILPADSFLIISSTTNTALFTSYGRVLGIPSFPSLLNEGTMVILQSKEGIVIHAVNYTSEWYKNPVKADGGWSLEMIDTKNPCEGVGNWKVSVAAPGGTPGRKNSVDAVNQDETPPQLIRTYCPDSLTVVAVFNESLDSLSASNKAAYSFNNLHINSVTPEGPLFNEVTIRLAEPMQKKTAYNLAVNSVTDCKGNSIAGFNKARAGWAEEALPGDLVINEILFDPRAGASDYLEVYNNSDKIIDASHLYVANRNTAGELSSVKKFSGLPQLIFPGDYLVLTEDAISLQKEYLVKDPSSIMTLSSLPSFPDDKGNAIVTNLQGQIVDEVPYSSKWHFALIGNVEGVALERIDPSGSSVDAGNWHSAASTAGYGTPGYRNSQYGSNESGGATIEVSPKIFSPDNDGLDDIATIKYLVEERGYVANITLFNSNGMPVRFLARNQTLG
ncbi:MAG TPA: lamin tail domain-containing protein, partial [Flavisolibacter sp.]|nr:lamin tail domain-containing protein [Flavisolibacter sp.]